MQLSDAQIKEFQKIYYDKFNENISSEDAYEAGLKLIQLLKLTYKPIKKK